MILPSRLFKKKIKNLRGASPVSISFSGGKGGKRGEKGGKGEKRGKKGEKGGKGGHLDVLIAIRHHLNRTAAIGAHERQVFDKLLWGLVTSTIFVRC